MTPVTYEVLDIGDIDQLIPDLVARGIATQNGDVITLDVAQIGVEKVLGGGQVTHKLALTAVTFSGRAVTKIEALGGTTQTSE
jgi:large subunit ribosomal protein L15